MRSKVKLKHMTAKKSSLLLLPLFVVAVLLSTSNVSAQSGTSSALAGTVVDSTGASVVGAKITATDVNTRAVRTGATDTVGHYLLSQVNPGTYQVSVASPGFGIAASEATAVGVGRTVTLNFTLSVGSASQIVEVTAQQGLLSLDNPNTTTTLEAKTIRSLPNPGEATDT